MTRALTGLLAGALLLAACATDDELFEEAAPTEPAVIRATVESATVVPGKPFFLTVTTDVREDVTLVLPDVGKDIEGLVLIDLFEDPPERVGDRIVSRSRYKLRAPIEGTYLIPGVEGPWKTEDLQVGTTGTGPILVEATRLGTQEEELRDLKPAIAPPPSIVPLVLGLAAAAALSAVVLVIWVLLRRRPTPGPPPRPAHELALEALGVLATSELLREHDQGPFAYELSAILRRYLEARYGFRAWRMTTPEVLRGMPPELASSRRIEASVRQVLEASDFVKFAGQPVPVPVLKTWISEAREVVQATRPSPEGDA